MFSVTNRVYLQKFSFANSSTFKTEDRLSLSLIHRVCFILVVDDKARVVSRIPPVQFELRVYECCAFLSVRRENRKYCGNRKGE